MATDPPYVYDRTAQIFRYTRVIVRLNLQMHMRHSKGGFKATHGVGSPSRARLLNVLRVTQGRCNPSLESSASTRKGELPRTIDERNHQRRGATGEKQRWSHDRIGQNLRSVRESWSKREDYEQWLACLRVYASCIIFVPRDFGFA